MDLGHLYPKFLKGRGHVIILKMIIIKPFIEGLPL